MLNCKQATEVVSNGLDRQLTLPERIKLRLHLIICKHCQNYAKQLKFIHRLSLKAEHYIEQQPNSLTPEAKARLVQQIQQQSQAGSDPP